MKARTEALDERGKTLVGKFQNAPRRLAKIAGGALNIAGAIASFLPNVVGRTTFAAFGDKKLEKGSPEWEASQAKYIRASQVVMGAAFGTGMGIWMAPATMVGAMGGAGAYGLFTFARVISATSIGKHFADFADMVNKRTFDKSRKTKYHDAARDTEIVSVEGLKKQQQAAAKGNYQARQKRNQAIKIGAAVAGGGATSLGMGIGMNNLLGVQHALAVHGIHSGVDSHGQAGGAGPGNHGLNSGAHTGGPVHGQASGAGPGGHEGASTAKAPKPHLEIGGPNAENANLNDADKLFGHYGLMLDKQFGSMAHPPASVEAYLKVLHHGGATSTSAAGENYFSKHLGFSKFGPHSASEVMHKGDMITLDNHDQIVIQWADHARPPHVLFDASGKPNTDFTELAKHMAPVRHVAEHAKVGPAAPEAVKEATAGPRPVVPPGTDQSAATPPPRPVVPPGTSQPAATPPAPLTPPVHEAVTSAPSTSDTITQTVPPEIPAVAPNFITNHFGLNIDQNHAHLYAGRDGSVIAYGGTLEERSILAGNYVTQNHNAVVFQDGSVPGLNGGRVPHIGRIMWDPDSNSINSTTGAMEPTLAGVKLPTVEDLARQIDSGQ